MNIKAIELQGFTTYAGARLELPERGVVLVRGANGSGKSSLIEGVAWALWGETLRGGDPVAIPGQACRSTIEMHDGVTFERRRTKSKTSLQFGKVNAGGGFDGPVYESTTKAEEAAARVVGAFDVWRRSHVFSSADAVHFTLATDSQRKRLLETLLGLGRFDDALEACRVDLRDATQAHALKGQNMAVLTARVQEAQKRTEDARRVLETTKEAAAVDEPYGQNLRAMIVGANAELAELRNKQRDLERAGGAHDAEARAAEERLRRLGTEVCGSCDQPIPESMLGALNRAAREARARVEAAKSTSRAALASVTAAIVEAEEELYVLRGKLRAFEAVAAVAASTAQQLARARAALSDANNDEQALAVKLVDAAHGAEAADREMRILQSCERALGLKGIRAHVLASSLTGLEAAANLWLRRLSQREMLVRLKPYTEKKTGGQSDSIGLEIVGAGGGVYKGASGGERRRVDVAMMLGLAEAAGAAHGHMTGTMFFDEVADALDVEGQAALAEALGDLGQSRCVVVISHSEAMAHALRPALSVTVSSGRFMIA